MLGFIVILWINLKKDSVGVKTKKYKYKGKCLAKERIKEKADKLKISGSKFWAIKYRICPVKWVSCEEK